MVSMAFNIGSNGLARNSLFYFYTISVSRWFNNYDHVKYSVFMIIIRLIILNNNHN